MTTGCYNQRIVLNRSNKEGHSLVIYSDGYIQVTVMFK